MSDEERRICECGWPKPISCEYCGGWYSATKEQHPEHADHLRRIIAAMYQIAGALDCPAHILDVLSDPDSASPRQVDDMLPFLISAKQEQPNNCNPHPDAPHGFDRNASHNADRYVCECEGWQSQAQPLPKFDQAEFDGLVDKGTRAWADTPDKWLEELRGSEPEQEQP